MLVVRHTIGHAQRLFRVLICTYWFLLRLSLFDSRSYLYYHPACSPVEWSIYIRERSLPVRGTMVGGVPSVDQLEANAIKRLLLSNHHQSLSVSH